MKRVLLLGAATLLFAEMAWAQPACINRFVRRTEGPRQMLTLLTGKLTFQEAHKLAAAIKQGQAEPLELVDEEEKVVAKQHGELRVVRPMPVGCDGRNSGAIVVATFTTVRRPSVRAFIRIKGEVVQFEEQE